MQVFLEQLSSESLVDVTLSCQGQFIKAHKMVLSACSPYFQVSLYHDVGLVYELHSFSVLYHPCLERINLTHALISPKQFLMYFKNCV